MQMDLVLLILILSFSSLLIIQTVRNQKVNNYKQKVHEMNIKRIKGKALSNPAHYPYIKRFYEDELRRYEEQKLITGLKDFSRIRLYKSLQEESDLSHLN